jgi:arginine deiminase
MKTDFTCPAVAGPTAQIRAPFAVRGETDRLTHVALAAPRHLEAVPCCSATRESLRAGFKTSPEIAVHQHQALRSVLAREGVICLDLPCSPDLPDQCFVRDVAVTTPWGLVALNPALPHRSPEVPRFLAWAGRLTNTRIDQITAGTIEGGDICVARPGLLIIGVSGERTTEAGAQEFAKPFRASGWDVLTYRFDPKFLHLDTIFCMVSPRMALACVEVLDQDFIEALVGQGIELLPVSYFHARKLGCNLLSIDAHTAVVSSGTPEVTTMLDKAGVRVLEVDIGQLTSCGGGIHCLTLPLVRV